MGTSGDYAPFSSEAADPQAGPEGFDIAVARAFARDRGLELRFVAFRWPELLGQLERKRFDVAMGGITVGPERSAAGRFSVPVAETGAVLLVSPRRGWLRAAEADRQGARIGVNAGGHLERVARLRFPAATLIAIPDNRAVLAALLDDRIDAAVTDTLEVRAWREADPRMRVLGPFTRDRKAYLVRADRPELAEALDAWLLAREADGTLGRLRQAYLGAEAGAATAQPLDALFAALDERISLMPLVGAAKRRRGLPLLDPAREAAVLAAALAAARDEAERRGIAPPPDVAVERLFRAQLEAARQLQRAALEPQGREAAAQRAAGERSSAEQGREAAAQRAAGERSSTEPGREAAPPAPAPERLPDLERELRPAILRIDERIARLIFALPGPVDPAAARAAARDQLRTPGLAESSRQEIADAVVELWRTPAPAAPEADQPRSTSRISRPASTGITRHRA